jgi:hypothetical protein|tara:strand:+ start:85 stop:588 length:504 start_codon:yes stop_codon:yes gene_type:complete
MVEVFDCSYISKVNNKQFQKALIKYTKETKCCDAEVCVHPKIQSDLNIDQAFTVIDDSINNLFKNYLQTDKFEFTKKNVWSYYASKGSQLQNVVHNHIFKKERGLQLSAVMYITPTKLGTDFTDFKIKPEINKWYLWHSGLFHHPEDGVTTEDRIVLALSSVVILTI